MRVINKLASKINALIDLLKNLAAMRKTVEDLTAKAELWVRTNAERIVAVPLAFIKFYSGIAMIAVKIAEALYEFPKLKKDLDGAFADLNAAAAATPKKRGRKAKVVETTAPAAEVKIRMRKVRKDKGQKRKRPVFTPTTIISTISRTPRSTSPASPVCVVGDCLGCDKVETCSMKGALS